MKKKHFSICIQIVQVPKSVYRDIFEKYFFYLINVLSENTTTQKIAKYYKVYQFPISNLLIENIHTLKKNPNSADAMC